MIRIVVVDDHEVVRAGICRLLDGEGDMEVVADTGSGHRGVALCRAERPEVIVLDYSLPDLDGLEVTRQIAELESPPRVLVLTMHANEEYATRVIRAGAAGFVAKVAPADELLSAIRKVAAQGIYVSAQIMEKMVARMGRPAAEAQERAWSDREHRGRNPEPPRSRPRSRISASPTSRRRAPDGDPAGRDAARGRSPRAGDPPRS